MYARRLLTVYAIEPKIETEAGIVEALSGQDSSFTVCRVVKAKTSNEMAIQVALPTEADGKFLARSVVEFYQALANICEKWRAPKKL